jgi:hypothetical protein
MVVYYHVNRKKARGEAKREEKTCLLFFPHNHAFITGKGG